VLHRVTRLRDLRSLPKLFGGFAELVSVDLLSCNDIPERYILDPPCDPDEESDVRGEPRDGSFCLERGSWIAHANLDERDIPPLAAFTESASNIASAAGAHLIRYVAEMRVHREKLHFERGHDYRTRHFNPPISVWRLMSAYKFRRGSVDLR
jgi:hypothetical protein